MMQTNKKVKKRKDQKAEDQELAKNGINLENKPLQKEEIHDDKNQARILVFDRLWFRWILNK